MADLNFTKMHGAGNDFIIVDNREDALPKARLIALAPTLCNRHFGIGADGIISLQRADDPALNYTMFYRNADGSDAGMCGNGARCLALFAAEAGLGTHFSFKVHDTVYEATVDLDHHHITLSFPLQVGISEEAGAGSRKIYQIYAGTEHLVLQASEADFRDDDKLRRQGKTYRYDSRFNPPGTNVNFIVGLTPTKIRLKTYERGVEDLTLACGTGAIASALAWHHINKNNHSSQHIGVQAEGGTLAVDFSYNKETHLYSAIQLSGEAQFVYEGTYAI